MVRPYQLNEHFYTSLNMPDKICSVKNELFYYTSGVKDCALILAISVNTVPFFPMKIPGHIS